MIQRKKFETLEEAVEWLENQMIIAAVREAHTEQLNYLDEAVEKSDMREAKEVIKYIMEK